jgi:hypothetical protein
MDRGHLWVTYSPAELMKGGERPEKRERDSRKRGFVQEGTIRGLICLSRRGTT